ncbi:hypothetical protein [Streptomyces sp. NPDC048643]|uniref:hypothetical protein n=1 Tax=Streptomyces sp. NPDC048643 TaxID=3155637 RepID=UPI0034198F05
MGPGRSERRGDGGSPGRRATGAVRGGGRGVALGVRAAVGSLLAAAMRALADDGEAEAHAVAAFRAARDGGAHAAPTRRRDDWRRRRSAAATGSRGNAERDPSDAGVPDTGTARVEAAAVTTETSGTAAGATGAAGVPRQAGDRTD